MSFKFVITTETLTPSHYPEFEHDPKATARAQSFTTGMRWIIEQDKKIHSSVNPIAQCLKVIRHQYKLDL
jgi:hypothetical protein